ncbi:uncharacterized protein LOC101450041 [Ceratitis capitata]|uniref:uncharacterized protein LOC101450041 n=1 Tax=Ceratitis capitata TaxID=7213 RepID=UPI000329D9AD|nr:uncharacterized protein LOC101450041 [Ceratitis capitata]
MDVEFKVIWLICLLSLPFEGSAHGNITAIREKVKELNEHGNIETNIFIYNKSEVQIQEYINKGTPTILVNRQKTNFTLIYNYNKSLLAIVLLSEQNKTELLLILNELLMRLRHLKVLLILPATLSHEQSQLELFRWCWQSGYTQVMSLMAHENTLTLTSYSPFPAVHLVAVERTADYFRSNLPHDFQGQILRTPLAYDPPSVFRYTDRYGRQQTSGMMYKLFLHFVQIHNATIEEVILPPPYPGTLVYENIFEAMRAGKIDISVHVYFTDVAKWHVSETPFLFPHYFRVPYARPLASRDYIVRPFRPEVWRLLFSYLLLAAMLFTFATVIAVKIKRLRRIAQCQRRGEIRIKQKKSLSSLNGQTSKVRLCFLQLRRTLLRYLFTLIDITMELFALLQQSSNCYGYQYHNHFCLTLMYACHNMLAFILINYYNKLIVSFLTTGVFEAQLNSVEDILASPYAIQLTRTDTPYFIDDPRLLRKVKIVDRNELWQQHISLNNSVILLSSMLYYNFFAAQQDYLRAKRVRIFLQEVIWDVSCGMFMPLESPYVEPLKETLLWSFNTGLISKDYHEAKSEAFTAGMLQFMREENVWGSSLKMDFFCWAWCVCAVGYACGGIILIFELIWHKMVK